MQIHAERQVRHDLLISPASDADAARLLFARLNALAHAHHAGEADPLATFMGRMKHMAAWVHDDAAFASLLYRASGDSYVLEMISEHPDHANDTFELSAEEAEDFVAERRAGSDNRSRPRTLDEVKALSFTTVQLAARWQCRRDTVDYMVEGGHLGAFRIGRFRHIRRDEVEKFERAVNMAAYLRDTDGNALNMDRALNHIAVRLRAARKAARSTA